MLHTSLPVLLSLLLFITALQAQEFSLKKNIEFDHLYVVVPDSTYNKILSHPFMLDQFASIDKGRPDFEPIDTSKKEAYFRFGNSYFELLSSRNRWAEEVGKIGIGWVTNQSDKGVEMRNELKTYYPNHLRVSREEDSAGHRLYSTYYIGQTRGDKAVRPVDYWIYDYTPFYITQIYGDQTRPIDVTGKRYRRKDHYEPDKLVSDIVEIGLNLVAEDLEAMSVWLSSLGYKKVNDYERLIFHKDRLRLVLGLSKKENTLSHLTFAHNRTDRKATLRFSSSCVLEIGRKYSVWRF